MIGTGQENIKLRGYEAAGNISPVGVYTWNTGTLAWEKQVPISAGGGGGAVTMADGASVTLGAIADASTTGGTGTISSKLRGLTAWAYGRMPASLGQKVMTASLPVVIAADQTGLTVTVTGSLSTIPVSGDWLTDVQLRASPPDIHINDGADETEGAKADAAIITDTTGTLSGKLRGLVKWAFERMPASLGSKVSASSLPVVIASDQGAVSVTGPLTDIQLRASAVPVSGAFFPATQPVSAVALPLPAGAATLAAQTQPGVDIGDVTINNGVGAAAVNIQDGGNSITVDAPVGTPAFVRLSDGAAALIAQKTMALSVPVVIASDQSAVPVTAPTLTKGTQSANGWSVQNLKDAGRNTRIFMLDAFTAAPVAEALQSVVQWYGNAAVAGTTQPAVVPAGKTLRLIGYQIDYRSLATVGSAVVRIRANTAGLVVIGSPLVFSFSAGSIAGATTVAMTGGFCSTVGAFPDGIELPAATGVGFSMAGYGPTGVLTLEGVTRFIVFGFEY